jgi:hypothetical protein
MDGEVWHLVEARRDDGAPTIFRIRELAPRPELSRIFVVEMPYPITEMSRLPNATGYRRLAQFEEQWLGPACSATGYEQVGLKIEEGSFFLYLYGANEPNDLVARLAPFDAALGFYDDADPTWGEYATLRDLLEEAKAMAPTEVEPAVSEPAKVARAATTLEKPTAKKAPAKTSAAKKPAAKTSAANKAAAKKSATKARAKKPAAKKPAAKKPSRNRRR